MRFYIKESCFKVAKCEDHQVFIRRKVVLKMRNVWITRCSSQGKLFKVVRSVYITACAHESCFIVMESMYYCVFIPTKVVLKLRNVYHFVFITRKAVLMF